MKLGSNYNQTYENEQMGSIKSTEIQNTSPMVQVVTS